MLISSSLVGTVLTALGANIAPPAAAPAVDPLGSTRQVASRIWVENERDYYRRGDRLNVRFSVSDDAYVAVVHIDTEGNLDFLYPASPWDNEWVRGGRVHTLPARGAGALTVRSRPGIGYFYLIASPMPLDFEAFRGRMGASPWEWGYAGRTVYGDPFLALEQMTRLLVPRWPYAPYVYDYYGYYVDGIHRYPAYACSDRYLNAGWGWSPSYGSCAQHDYFLRQNPYYYDTRRYAGDRRSYLRRYDGIDPRHGFKEPPNQPARGIPGVGTRQNLQGGGTGTAPAPREDVTPRREPAPASGTPRGAPEATPQRAPQATPQRAPQAAPATGRQPQPGAAGASRGTTGSTGAPAAAPPGRRPAPD